MMWCHDSGHDRHAVPQRPPPPPCPSLSCQAGQGRHEDAQAWERGPQYILAEDDGAHAPLALALHPPYKRLHVLRHTPAPCPRPVPGAKQWLEEALVLQRRVKGAGGGGGVNHLSGCLATTLAQTLAGRPVGWAGRGVHAWCMAHSASWGGTCALQRMQGCPAGQSEDREDRPAQAASRTRGELPPSGSHLLELCHVRMHVAARPPAMD